jgi:hypothetical protein
MHAQAHAPLEIPGVDDRELNLFIKDVPFNFALEQALASLQDPGVLAEVARLRAIITQILVYTKISWAVQELSEAFSKFQKCLNEKTSQLVEQLDMTKKRMKAAQLHSRTQAALVELAQARELRGEYYWPHIPGILEDPSHHYVQLKHTASMEAMQGSTTQSAEAAIGNASNHGCIVPNYQEIQWAYNVCRLCGNQSHWIRKCNMPRDWHR